MATKFLLKGLNLKAFVPIFLPIKPPPVAKSRYEILEFGTISDTNDSGSDKRIHCRNGRKESGRNPYENPDGKMCWWHRVPIEGKCRAIPIRITEECIWGDGFFCCNGCVYAYLIDHMKLMPVYRNPNYENSIFLLHQIHMSEFPGDELVPSPDWKLLDTVGGGSMNLKDFMEQLKGVTLSQETQLRFEPVTVVYRVSTAQKFVPTSGK